MSSEAEKTAGFTEGGAQIAMINYSEKELEAKEFQLRASIAKNYGRIRDVEKELSELQLQLHMNVAPKRHGLEHLRRKIEIQSEKVSAAFRANEEAQKIATAAAEALAAEERTKEQLCAELNLLVQQSARGQVDKLEQLTQRLETLNAGLSMSEHHEGEQVTAPEQSTAATTTSGKPPSQGGQQQGASPQNGEGTNINNSGGGGALPTSRTAASSSTTSEEAIAARSRHVQLPSSGGKQGRQQNSNSSSRNAVAVVPLQQQQQRQVKETRDAHGAFRGFE